MCTIERISFTLYDVYTGHGARSVQQAGIRSLHLLLPFVFFCVFILVSEGV